MTTFFLLKFDHGVNDTNIIREYNRLVYCGHAQFLKDCLTTKIGLPDVTQGYAPFSALVSVHEVMDN
jgi:hypothetical protein